MTVQARMRTLAATCFYCGLFLCLVPKAAATQDDFAAAVKLAALGATVLFFGVAFTVTGIWLFVDSLER